MGVQYRRGANAERAAARLLGGVRTGNRGTAAPTSRSAIGRSSRSRRGRSLPAWLKHAVHQAEVAAGQAVSPRLPIVQLHEVGGRVVDDLIVIRAGEFRSWYGDLSGERQVTDHA